jgi:curved DNA-binding protein CbpA
MDPSRDYYAVLGLLPSIEPAAIRAAYLALLKKYHPDVCKSRNDEATRRTKELNEAYDVLSNEKHREKYDSLRANFYRKYGRYKKQYNKKTVNNYNIDTYWQSYGEQRVRSRQNKAKAENYRNPWTAKKHDRMQGDDRLRVLVVGIVVSVALAFIISAFAGSA